MSRKKQRHRTWFDLCQLVFSCAIPFLLLIAFLCFDIIGIRHWMRHLSRESVLKKEGVTDEGTIISWRDAREEFRMPPQLRDRSWMPTAEFVDEKGSKHSFESLLGRGFKNRDGKTLAITYARSNPGIVLDDEARTYFTYALPCYVSVLSFCVIALAAGCIAITRYGFDEYERRLPKAERRRRQKIRARSVSE